ncbi:hypothetical protein ACI7K7_001513 [Escherichia coli]|uniref:hypothetical protein n=1 Tax=Enterobacteriaceae TaxID=543 RepID=UPI0003C5C076|nr:MULTISPECIES: hypothetical protein [Enterobacteriaceae]MBU5623124.1 hypothetical protein [Enterobacteriaceae bacterium S5_ASV_15]EFC8057756.1 hypothetical protein [Escherichia coli]EFD0784532.1 hypothetical protein [Escherichia coli]EFN5501795.1 hypothetical protein [Escherichia coli]EGH1139088.1 hypothetical protein [Escherichia coli]
MSDYDDYAEWQRQQANVNAGRSAGNGGTFQEALKRPRYGEPGRVTSKELQNQIENPSQMPEENCELPPTIYTDQNGKKFRFILGQRVYFEE